jgi:hypothetical protein
MRNRGHWIAIMCAAALTLGFCSGPLGDWRSRHVSEPLFQPLSAAARQEYVNLFSKVWRRRGYDITAEMWQTAGFDAAWTVDHRDLYLELSERSGGRNGLGSYLLRTSPHGWVLLEAPHSDDDLYTGRIVRNLFLTGLFAGAGFNSLSRWSVDRQAHYGDFARREDTAFAAFAVAYLAEHPGGTVVQIHGFDTEKRGEASFADADIVVSEGTDAPGPWTQAFRDCLERLLPGRILLYPEDTRELGGTRNATGQIVRQGGGYFLHLELSLNLRNRLRRDSALTDGFSACLDGTWQS